MARKSSRVAWAGALLASACNAEPPPKAAEPSFRVDLPPATPAAALAPPSSPPSSALRPEPLRPPADPACILHAEAFPLEYTKLALGPGRAPYVELNVARGVADVAVGEGESPVVHVSTRTKAVVLEGVVSGPLALHPARPFLATPHFAPGPEAPTALVSAKSGALRLKIEAPAALTFADGRGIVAERPCADVGLLKTRFDPLLAFPSRVAKRRALSKSKLVPLFDGPQGKRVASLTVRDVLELDVFEERAGHALVRTKLEGGAVEGWASAADLAPFEPGVAYGTGAAGGIRPDRHEASARRARCDRDVPLVARQGEERATVGRVLTGAVMHLVTGPREGYVGVSVEGAGVFVADGARLEVAEADVAGCPAD